MMFRQDLEKLTNTLPRMARDLRIFVQLDKHNLHFGTLGFFYSRFLIHLFSPFNSSLPNFHNPPHSFLVLTPNLIKKCPYAEKR